MTLQEIKNAIKENKIVCWANEGYQVMGKDLDDLNIVCLSNQYCIGLTWRDGVTMNGEEKDFFIKQ
jgi:transcriptional antiterminator Rof (Rho-off)